jgi:RNAse (barnase) inhibitor barstar
MQSDDQQQPQAQALTPPLHFAASDSNSLDWGEDVSYQWVLRPVGMVYADVCGVRDTDHKDVFSFVVFHHGEGERNPDLLFGALAPFLIEQHELGYNPSKIRRIYTNIKRWFGSRYLELPDDMEQDSLTLLHVWDVLQAEVLAGPLTLAEFEY